jgi:hypothetical protein
MKVPAHASTLRESIAIFRFVDEHGVYFQQLARLSEWSISNTCLKLRMFKALAGPFRIEKGLFRLLWVGFMEMRVQRASDKNHSRDFRNVRAVGVPSSSGQEHQCRKIGLSSTIHLYGKVTCQIFGHRSIFHWRKLTLTIENCKWGLVRANIRNGRPECWENRFPGCKLSWNLASYLPQRS